MWISHKTIIFCLFLSILYMLLLNSLLLDPAVKKYLLRKIKLSPLIDCNSLGFYNERGFIIFSKIIYFKDWKYCSI